MVTDIVTQTPSPHHEKASYGPVIVLYTWPAQAL